MRIDAFALRVLDAIEHYWSAHHRRPGEVQVSPHDFERMAKGSGIVGYDLLWLWGCPARAVDTVAVGRVRLVVKGTP